MDDGKRGGTTVRLVAKLTIAVAALLSTAITCWAQARDNGYRTAAARSGAPALIAAQPSLTPPQSVEGTWVSDDGAEAMPEAVAAPGISAEEMSDSQCPIEGGECDQFGDGCDPSLGPRGPCWNDLWAEVHSHKRIYAQVDYLSLWTTGNALPPLVTTSPPGTPQAEAGVLPVSESTSILFGNGKVDGGQRNGARLNVGYWLVDGEFVGVEGHYFALQTGKTSFNAASNFTDDPNAQILARPFFDVGPLVVTPRENSALVAYPNFVNGQSIGDLNGSINISTTSNLQSAGALWRKLIWIDFTMQRRFDLLLGYRFLRIDDSVTINDQSSFTGGIFPTINLTSQDIFSARNFFNGGEIGFKYQSYHGPFSLEVIAKSAFGDNEQNVYIAGSNTITVAGGAPTTTAGGLLAQPTNIGTYQRNVFAVLPEADVNLRLDVTPHVRLTLGYMFLYMNNVQRSGDAIDRTLNPSQIRGHNLVGTPAPLFSPHDSTYYAHGATAGVEVRW
jgi:hypothetical protein